MSQATNRARQDEAPTDRDGQHWPGALCQQFPDSDSLWFSEDGDPSRITRALCMACPVRPDCLEYAMEHETQRGTRYGVWGGLNPRQRSRLALQRKREAEES